MHKKINNIDPKVVKLVNALRHEADDPWDFNSNTIKDLNWQVIPLTTFDEGNYDEDDEDIPVKDKEFTKKYCLMNTKKGGKYFSAVCTETQSDLDRFFINNDFQSLCDFIYSKNFDGEGRAGLNYLILPASLNAALLVTSEEYSLFASSQDIINYFFTREDIIAIFDYFKGDYAESFSDCNIQYDYLLNLCNKYWWDEFKKIR